MQRSCYSGLMAEIRFGEPLLFGFDVFVAKATYGKQFVILESNTDRCSYKIVRFGIEHR